MVLSPTSPVMFATVNNFQEGGCSYQKAAEMASDR